MIVDMVNDLSTTPRWACGLVVLDWQGKVLSLEAVAADEVDLQLVVGDMSPYQLVDGRVMLALLAPGPVGQTSETLTTQLFLACR